MPSTRASGCDAGRPKIQCLQVHGVGLAAPHERDRRRPRRSGTSCAARNASTAAASGVPRSSSVRIASAVRVARRRGSIALRLRQLARQRREPPSSPSASTSSLAAQPWPRRQVRLAPSSIATQRRGRERAARARDCAARVGEVEPPARVRAARRRPPTSPSPASSTCGDVRCRAADSRGRARRARRSTIAPRRPRDDRACRPTSASTSNRRRRLSSDATWPPAIASASQRVEERARAPRAARATDGALGGLPARVELGVHLARSARGAPRRARARASIADARSSARGAAASPWRASIARARLERRVEPHASRSPASGAAAAWRAWCAAASSGSAAKTSLAARVQLEVHRAAAEVLVQLLVVGLALLPAGGDGARASPATPSAATASASVGPEALRAEEREPARDRRRRAQWARTFTVARRRRACRRSAS